MVQSLLQGLLNFLIGIFIYIMKVFNTLLIIPLMGVIGAILPNFGDYLDIFYSFLSDYVFKGIAFMREVFLNVTGYPRPLFNLLIIFYFGRIGLMTFLRLRKFIKNMWKLVKTGN